jgi:O-antigen/teichoic acid export membrane protein
MAFVASFYPAMSFYWANDKKQLARSFERAVIYLIIISLPISAGVIAIANKIMLVFRSDFNDAVLPLQIIIAALIFIFINFPIGSFLNACDKQKQNTVNMGIVLIASVSLNLILIPKFQAVGASITVLAANSLMTALGAYWVLKTISFDYKKVLLVFLKTLLAATLMASLVFFLKETVNFFIVVAIGGVVYAALLFLFGAVTVRDMKNMYILFFHKT